MPKVELENLESVEGIGEITLTKIRKKLIKENKIKKYSLDQMDFPNNQYEIIYADPPWSYYNGTTKEQTEEDFGDFYNRPDQYYNLLSIEDLKKFPVETISASQSLLFMWATGPKLHRAIELIRGWGFKFVTVPFVWVKTQKDGSIRQNGNGWYTIQNAEYVLLGRKGARLDRSRKDQKQMVLEPNQEHSKKPEEIRRRIDRMYQNREKIELFAREEVEDWDVWGEEV